VKQLGAVVRDLGTARAAMLPYHGRKTRSMKAGKAAVKQSKKSPEIGGSARAGYHPEELSSQEDEAEAEK
jgi:hypothetical protein